MKKNIVRSSNQSFIWMFEWPINFVFNAASGMDIPIFGVTERVHFIEAALMLQADFVLLCHCCFKVFILKRAILWKNDALVDLKSGKFII